MLVDITYSLTILFAASFWFVSYCNLVVSICALAAARFAWAF